MQKLKDKLFEAQSALNLEIIEKFKTGVIIYHFVITVVTYCATYIVFICEIVQIIDLITSFLHLCFQYSNIWTEL